MREMKQEMERDRHAMVSLWFIDFPFFLRDARFVLQSAVPLHWCLYAIGVEGL